jgi:hypothetical protein
MILDSGHAVAERERRRLKYATWNTGCSRDKSRNLGTSQGFLRDQQFDRSILTQDGLQDRITVLIAAGKDLVHHMSNPKAYESNMSIIESAELGESIVGR